MRKLVFLVKLKQVKYQFLSRDVLKLIAIVSMLLDHVGKLFFPNVLILQIIGRLAMPIFAFFIAEGFHYTRNKLKYFLTIFIFAVIAQIPYNFLWQGLNILFTFACSLFLLWLWDCAKNLGIIEKIMLRLIVFLVFMMLSCVAYLTKLDYRWYGILLPFVFYSLRNKPILKFLSFAAFTGLFVAEKIALAYPFVAFGSFMQLFAVGSVFLLAFYNKSLSSNKKLKYVFYIFYPLHLIILLALTLVF